MISVYGKNNRASAYFMTLTAAVVLVSMVLGLSYLMLQFRHTSRSSGQVDQARIYADLGIQHALHFTEEAYNWRDILPNGVWLSNVTAGDGTYTVGGIDSTDGDLTDDSGDPVLLTAMAAVGGVTRTVQVQAQNAPILLLRYAVAAGDTVDINNDVQVFGDVTSNANIDKSGGGTWIYGDAEAVGIVHETENITGDIVPNSDAKLFPNNGTILAYYSARATAIPYQGTMEEVVLSPTSNPYGLADPDGLYLIDCGGEKIVIRNCRIVGTLILVNPKDSSLMEKGLNWRPARSDYPALIVDGLRMTIKPDPFLPEDGKFDVSLPTEPGFGTMAGSYPSIIEGLVYCSGELKLEKDCSIQGMAMAGGVLTLNDDAQIQYDPALRSNPPKCFSESHLSVTDGTWRQIIP